MVEILTSVRAGIQIRIGLWIIPSFFTFGHLLVDLEVFIWLNLRFLNWTKFGSNPGWRNSSKLGRWHHSKIDMCPNHVHCT